MTQEFSIDKKILSVFTLGTTIFNSIESRTRPDHYQHSEKEGMGILFRIPKKKMIYSGIQAPSTYGRQLCTQLSEMIEASSDVTSFDSDDLRENRACITFKIEKGDIIHCAITGLKRNECFTMAIILMAKVTELSIIEVLSNISKRGGRVPPEVLQEGQYLNQLLNSYK